MTKKIRLIDEEPVAVEETAPAAGGAFTPEQVEQLMKYAEAIDWKMWEILKLLRSQVEDK